MLVFQSSNAAEYKQFSINIKNHKGKIGLCNPKDIEVIATGDFLKNNCDKSEVYSNTSSGSKLNIEITSWSVTGNTILFSGKLSGLLKSTMVKNAQIEIKDGVFTNLKAAVYNE